VFLSFSHFRGWAYALWAPPLGQPRLLYAKTSDMYVLVPAGMWNDREAFPFGLQVRKKNFWLQDGQTSSFWYVLAAMTMKRTWNPTSATSSKSAPARTTATGYVFLGLA